MLVGDHGRQRVRDPDRRLPDRAADEGRDGRGARRAGAHDARAAPRRSRSTRRPARHRRHRRRPADVQRLDDGGADRRRRRAARSPSTATARRPACRARPTCSRRSARGSTSTPSAVARCIEEVGFGFMFAPAHHQATRYVDPGAPRARGPHDLQLPRAADQPGRARRRQLIGVSDPRYLETMAGALALLGTEHALLVSSEDGLDELSISRADAGGRGRRRRAAPLHRHARGGRARAGAGRGDARRRPGSRTPTPRGGSSPASRGAARDLAVLNAGAAIYAGGGAGLARRRASQRPQRGDRLGRRRGGARALRRGARAELGPRVNELERIVAATRADVARRSARGADRRAGARGRAAPRAERRSRDALAAPGLSVIAEHKRRSPSAGVIRDGRLARGRGRRLRARRRRGAVGADRGPSFGGSLDDLRAAARRRALPILRKDFIVDPYQVRRGGRRRAPTRSC